MNVLKRIAKGIVIGFIFWIIIVGCAYLETLFTVKAEMFYIVTNWLSIIIAIVAGIAAVIIDPQKEDFH